MVSLNERINARGRVEAKRALRRWRMVPTDLQSLTRARNNIALFEPCGKRWAWAIEWSRTRRLLAASDYDLYCVRSWMDA